MIGNPVKQKKAGLEIQAMIAQVVHATGGVVDIPIGGWKIGSRIFLCTKCAERGKIPKKEDGEFDIDKIVGELVEGKADFSSVVVANAVLAQWKGKIKGKIMDEFRSENK